MAPGFFRESQYGATATPCAGSKPGDASFQPVDLGSLRPIVTVGRKGNHWAPARLCGLSFSFTYQFIALRGTSLKSFIRRLVYASLQAKPLVC